MQLSRIALSLPDVLLTHPMVQRFRAILGDVIGDFSREEGGYLLGRLFGTTFHIQNIYHDAAATGSFTGIQLSTGAFRKAEKLLSRGSDERVIGTWHLHPPNCSARFSQTDFETLFIDRMVLNATDPGKYQPWVHIIVPGLHLEEVQAFALEVRANLDVRSEQTRNIPKADLSLPDEAQCGFTVRDKRHVDQLRFLRFNSRILGAALRTGRLAGLWRQCEPKQPFPRWERVFIENFIRKLKSENGAEAKMIESAYSYVRLVPGNVDDMVVETYSFQTPSEAETEQFASLSVRLEAPRIRVPIENPDVPEESDGVEMRDNQTVGDLMNEIKARKGLQSAPVLWTLLNEDRAEEMRDQTRVEEFGKVYLPENLTIREVMAARATQDVPLYWQSPELASEVIRQLRTYRFQMMGYDVDLLAQKRVVIAGMGLLGCGIARLLATVGVGHLGMIDSGVVDWTNTYRQELYGITDVGLAKVDAAANKLRPMGTSCQTIRLDIPSVLVSDINAARRSLRVLRDVVADADLVIGTLDSFSSRATLQVICRAESKPFLAASLDYVPAFDLTEGSVGLYLSNDGACYGCGSELKLQKDRGACTNAPIEYPGIVNSLAAHYATEALLSKGIEKGMRCRVYRERNSRDYRVDVKALGRSAEKCEVCELAAMATAPDNRHWKDELVQWLIS